MMLDLLGKTLGQYKIVEEIGRGGMAVVYRAHQASLNRYVAIKVLPPQLAFDQAFVQRFEREAASAAQLQHPNIVAIYDVGSQDAYHYIVMEFLPGVTLGRLLDDGPLPLQRVEHILRQLAAALDYAHAQNILHRDLKPSNIMVGPDDHVKLMDFGLARAGDSSDLTRSGIVMGTPYYMSPEQAQGHKIDRRSDLYALGVVLYEMITGRIPFERDTPQAVLLAHVVEAPPPLHSLLATVPPAMEPVILRALAKNPARRYASAHELAEDFARAVAGAAPIAAEDAPPVVVAPPPDAPPPPPAPQPPVATPASSPMPAVAAPASNPTPAVPLPALPGRVPAWLRDRRTLFAASAVAVVLLASAFANQMLSAPGAGSATPTVTRPAASATAQPSAVPPTHTPSPAASPTRPPSATVTPAPSATATQPSPTTTPTPAATLTPTATPTLTHSPTATRRRPTNTVIRPTDTPVPPPTATATIEPTSRPDTATPKPKPPPP
jgi:predicted Ser/Thr protein kinase